MTDVNLNRFHHAIKYGAADDLYDTIIDLGINKIYMLKDAILEIDDNSDENTYAVLMDTIEEWEMEVYRLMDRGKIDEAEMYL